MILAGTALGIPSVHGVPGNGCNECGMHVQAHFTVTPNLQMLSGNVKKKIVLNKKKYKHIQACSRK